MPSSENTKPDPFADKLAALPPRPGVYLFRDKQGNPLYIGKATSLRARVRSYFQERGTDTRGFIPLLRRHASDVETIVTRSEKEAAILENSLIKENRPRYNVKLRDDKEYLTLRLDERHAWPKLDLMRRPEADGARYFGPYHSATAARRTLHLVEKHFQLRTCSDRDLESRQRPCLQFQIKRCLAPCVYEVDRALYAQQVRAVSLFLDGRHDELTRELEARMNEASQGLEFELAALYRDQLHAVELVRQAQRVVSVTDRDQDVLGFYREGDLVELAVLYVRSGRVVDATSFSMPRVELPDDEVVAAFVRDHYAEDGPAGAVIPDEVILPVLPEGAAGVEEWLAERRGKRVELLAPSRGTKRKLLELAMENARHAFDEKRRAAEDVDERLARLQQRLRLPTLPRRLECIDISHLGGNDTVGAIVSFLNGAPDKKRYRSFHVKSAGEGDDYGAIYEVLERRFRRSRPSPEGEPSENGWELPDLLVVDGGRGQLGVALTAAHDLGLHDLPVVGLAKERESPLGDKLVDRVYLPGQKNPIPLRPNSPELFLLARARDEAHRFANRGRKKLGKRRRIASELDQVRGVGPKTKRALLIALGSVAAIRAASDEQILAVPGVSKRQLEALREHFAGRQPPRDGVGA
jgi:excinuclease ABC subunit C